MHFPFLSTDNNSPFGDDQFTEVTGEECPPSKGFNLKTILDVKRSHTHMLPSVDPAETYRPSGEKDVWTEKKNFISLEASTMKFFRLNLSYFCCIWAKSSTWVSSSVNLICRRNMKHNLKKIILDEMKLTLDQSYVMRSEEVLRTCNPPGKQIQR